MAINGAFWAPGLTLAAVGGAAAAGPSLFPQEPKTQAVVAGGSALLGFAAGSLVQGLASGAGHVAPGGRMGALAALAGAGLLAAGYTKLTSDSHSAGGSLLGTAGLVTAAAAGAGIASTLIARRFPTHPGLAQLALPLVAGGGVLAQALLDRGSAGDYEVEGPELPAVDPSTKLATRQLEKVGADQLMPGVDPATVQLDKLPANGQRFLYERATTDEIAKTTGEPAKADPRRAYVGLLEAPEGLSEPELVEWMAQTAYDRLDAQGGFDRSHILVASTTATGYVNPIAPMSQEMMTGGDVATVAMQAGHKKAVFELKNLDRATAMHEALLAKIQDRIATMPAKDRPTVDVYGESYGAWASQDAFEGDGLRGLDEHGIEHAMYVGTPSSSGWKPEVEGSGHGDAVESVRSAAQQQEEGSAGDPRVTFLTHDADPVANFAIDDLWRRPAWLPADGSRGENVPSGQHWWPGVTGLQTAIDQQRAQYFDIGRLQAMGHDYRPEVAYVLRNAYDHDEVTDEQVARIREYGRQAELRWTAAKDELTAPGSATQPVAR